MRRPARVPERRRVERRDLVQLEAVLQGVRHGAAQRGDAAGGRERDRLVDGTRRISRMHHRQRPRAQDQFPATEHLQMVPPGRVLEMGRSRVPSRVTDRFHQPL